MGVKIWGRREAPDVSLFCSSADFSRGRQMRSRMEISMGSRNWAVVDKNWRRLGGGALEDLEGSGYRCPRPGSGE